MILNEPAVTHSNHVNSNPTSSTIKPLNILLVSVPLPGHSNALLALGEELVRRGHNVTFCSLDSSIKLNGEAIERGMNYLSAGSVMNDEFTRENSKNFVHLLSFSNPWKVYKTLMMMKEFIEMNTSPFIDYFMNEDMTQWDIIILGHLMTSIPCIAQNHNVSVISVVDISLKDLPPWPFPSVVSGKTDNLGFLDRLKAIPSSIFSNIIKSVLLSNTPITDQLCNNVFHWGPFEGWEYPSIVRTIIGFEYPRTISPLTEYVGPILSKLKKALPTDLSKWIQDKEDNSVIYISMGSLFHITADLAMALVNSTNQTEYSVVWSLINQHVLSGIELDTKKYFISSWTPQVTLLQHKSISMAILHGGSNGVHEALYYGVPLIVIPQFGDQAAWAAMVEHSEVGVQLKPHQVTSQTIKESIETIESGEYHKKAQKMSQIMKRAGGVDKAADLVEFYVNIGYDHLIPGPVKYKWSWIQYYNIDVHVTLLCIILIIMYCIVKVCKCCCRCCSKEKLKKE